MGTWQDSALPLVQRYGISVVLVLTSITHYGVCHKKKKEKRFNINAKIPGCSTVSRGGTEYVCALFWPFWPTIPCQIQREGQSSRCNVMAQYVPAVCTLRATLCTSVKCILEGRKAFRHLGIISNFVLPWNCVTLFWRHYILYCLSLGPFFFFMSFIF